jgi:hypothetical protein
MLKKNRLNIGSRKNLSIEKDLRIRNFNGSKSSGKMKIKEVKCEQGVEKGST